MNFPFSLIFILFYELFASSNCYSDPMTTSCYLVNNSVFFWFDIFFFMVSRVYYRNSLFSYSSLTVSWSTDLIYFSTVSFTSLLWERYFAPSGIWKCLSWIICFLKLRIIGSSFSFSCLECSKMNEAFLCRLASSWSVFGFSKNLSRNSWDVCSAYLVISYFVSQSLFFSRTYPAYLFRKRGMFLFRLSF